MVDDWVADLQLKQLAPASIKRKVATLRCFFNFFVRSDVLEKSPFDRLRFRFGSGVKIPKALNVDESRMLVKRARIGLANIQHWTGSINSCFLQLRNAAIIEVLMSTGMRVGELTALDLCSVDVSEQSLRVSGKGKRERTAFLINASVVETFERYFNWRSELELVTNSLFVNLRGFRISQQGVAYILRKMCQDLSTRVKVTPHVLRHTAATLLLQNGVDIRLVQEFMGHRSIATTQRYTHVTAYHLKSVLKKRHHGNHLYEPT